MIVILPAEQALPRTMTGTVSRGLAPALRTHGIAVAAMDGDAMFGIHAPVSSPETVQYRNPKAFIDRRYQASSA